MAHQLKNGNYRHKGTDIKIKYVGYIDDGREYVVGSQAFRTLALAVKFIESGLGKNG